jgi:hypothetical protein
MKRQALGLALLGFVGFAHATDWMLYAKTDNVSVFVAADRITREDKYAETWQKWVFNKPQSYNGKAYNYSIEQVSVYCDAAGYSTRVHAVTTYKTKGQPVASATAAGEWTTVIPDSIGEAVAMAICKQ